MKKSFSEKNREVGKVRQELTVKTSKISIFEMSWMEIHIGLHSALKFPDLFYQFFTYRLLSQR